MPDSISSVWTTAVTPEKISYYWGDDRTRGKCPQFPVGITFTFFLYNDDHSHFNFCPMSITFNLFVYNVHWESFSLFSTIRMTLLSFCTLNITFTFLENHSHLIFCPMRITFTFFVHNEHHFHLFFAQWESLSLSWTENCKYRNLLCSLFALTFQIF